MPAQTMIPSIVVVTAIQSGMRGAAHDVDRVNRTPVDVRE